jgi:hypothetical protein
MEGTCLGTSGCIRRDAKGLGTTTYLTFPDGQRRQEIASPRLGAKKAQEAKRAKRAHQEHTPRRSRMALLGPRVGPALDAHPHESWNVLMARDKHYSLHQALLQ